MCAPVVAIVVVAKGIVESERARAVVIMDVDASKRVAIVTGANTGIGRETALGLAKAGMKVFLACRNADKAREAATYIRQVVLPISLSFSHMHNDFSSNSLRAMWESFQFENSGIPLRTNVKGKIHSFPARARCSTTREKCPTSLLTLVHSTLLDMA